MCNAMETYFKYPGDVMPKHVVHECIGIFPITHVKGNGNIFNDLNVLKKKNKCSMEHVNIKVFLFLFRGFLEKYLMNHFKVTCLHDT